MGTDRINKVRKKNKADESNLTETKSIPILDKDSIWKLAFYGFIKTDYVYADRALLSYGRENLFEVVRQFFLTMRRRWAQSAGWKSTESQ